MKRISRAELSVKAHFVAGTNAWFRPQGDLRASQAIQDAEAFLAALPGNTPQPMLGAGTTANPNQVLTLTWPISGYPTIKSVSVSFKGNQVSDVYWDEPTGETHRITDLPVSKLDPAEIAGKIRNLVNNALPSAGSTFRHN